MNFFLIVLFVIPCFAFSAIIPIIQIRDGQVGGRQYATENNKTYYGFQGIPYASPPIGKLRFEPPQPPQPWSGVYDGTGDSKPCVSTHFLSNKDLESEDCLYINVYTPNLKAWWFFRLPVMFWIYGGDFVEGNSSKLIYGPDFFMEEDVILVTFNYRLGPLGFLSTEDDAILGNNGLKDQNMALKWTYENVKYFGGDPNKITIFGQSAGGASVASHILSKQSKGLFRAAIVESSSALVPWALDLNPKKYAFKLGENMGYLGNSTQKLKEFLQDKSIEEIYYATDYIKLDWPVLEIEHKNAFLTESNYALLKSGKFNRVPTIIGMCSEESLPFLLNMFVGKMEALVFDVNPEMLIPSDLDVNELDVKTVIKKIRDLYIQEHESFISNITGYAKYITDNMFSRGILKHAQLQSVFTPVYLYQFAYYGRPFIPAFIEGAEKAGHAAEIPFLFKLAQMNDKDPENLLTQQRLVRLWANFAKYLDPTPLRTSLLNFVKWPRVSPHNLQFLNINHTLEVRSSLKKYIFTSWDEIYQKYGKRPFITY